VPYPEPTQFVTFTFDDTPCSSTNALLDVMDEIGVRGTFFVSGINLVPWPPAIIIAFVFICIMLAHFVDFILKIRFLCLAHAQLQPTAAR